MTGCQECGKTVELGNVKRLIVNVILRLYIYGDVLLYVAGESHHAVNNVHWEEENFDIDFCMAQKIFSVLVYIRTD